MVGGAAAIAAVAYMMMRPSAQVTKAADDGKFSAIKKSVVMDGKTRKALVRTFPTESNLYV
jgi:hypothetical protein